MQSLRSRSASDQDVPNPEMPRRTEAVASSGPRDITQQRRQDAPHDTPNPNDRVFQATYPRTKSVPERKPPIDMVVSSISTYFRHIHPWLPFLNAQGVLADLAAVREPSLLHHAIFGAALPFLHDPRLDQLSSDAFWKYTKRRVLNETAEEPSYASLEAATVLCLDLSGMTNGPQVWSRLAMVASLASQLRRTRGGLILRQNVQEATAGGNRSGYGERLNSLQHARLFWAIYALDTYISLTTGQPGRTSDLDLRCFLPTREAAWNTLGRREATSLSSPANFFLLQLQLLDLARQAHGVYVDFLTLVEGGDDQTPEAWVDSVSSCSRELSSWLNDLPPEISIASSRMPPAAVMLLTYSHALVVHLNGLVMSCNQTPHASFISHIQQDAGEKCLQSIRIISDVTSQVTGIMDDQLGWPFAWTLWTAARYLLAVAASEDRSTPPQEFQVLTSSLGRMGRFWQISKKYWMLLRRAEAALRTRSSAGEILDGPDILSSVANLCIPTSHLEDQFRVDPVLSRAEEEAPHPAALTGSTSAPRMIGTAASPQQGVAPSEMASTSVSMPDESMFGLGQELSDVWFTTPLFASSAYHQFPGDSHSTDNPWYENSWQPHM